MKMVRLKPVTSEHDRGVLIKHSDRFLRAGHKVRVICRFQGRQNAHPEIGRAQLQTVADELAAIATVEGAVIKQGRDMIMNLTPRPGVKPLPKAPKHGEEAAIAATVEGTEAAHDPDADAEFEAIQQVIMGDDEDSAEDDESNATTTVVDITSDASTTNTEAAHCRTNRDTEPNR